MGYLENSIMHVPHWCVLMGLSTEVSGEERPYLTISVYGINTLNAFEHLTFSQLCPLRLSLLFSVELRFPTNYGCSSTSYAYVLTGGLIRVC